jgi:Flp pilus assembly protein TadG
MAVEFAILMPAFLALIALAFVVGRETVAQSAVEVAAHDAARAASISRTAGTAKARAQDAARTALAEQDLNCDPVEVDVDTGQFNLPAGEPASVTVRVACTVSYADVVPVPGLPGSRTLVSAFTSPLDVYRSRV